jgi:hemolysin D
MQGDQMNGDRNIEDKLPGSNNGQLAKVDAAELRPTRSKGTLANREESSLFTATNFGQSVVFQQSQVWSRAIVWGIMGITGALVLWACFARIDEAIPAAGKLEPLTDVKKVQAPISGVVKKVFVKNGDKVKAGDLLVQLESSVPESQLSSLASTKAALEEENRFYRSQLGSTATTTAVPKNANIKAEVLSLTKSRNALVAENKVFATELAGGNGSNLSADEQSRLNTKRNYQNSQIVGGNLDVGQVKKQMSENLVKQQGFQSQIESTKNIIGTIRSGIDSNKSKMVSELAQVDRQMAQNKARLIATQKSLGINQGILTDIKPAAEAGALSRVQVSRQEQEVSTKVSELEQQTQEQSRLQLEKQRIISSGNTDAQNQQQRLQEQQQQIKQRESDINQLKEEYSRLQLSAQRGVVKTSENVSGNRVNTQDRIAANTNKIAEIDSQINKIIVENEKKITEIGSQLTQAGQNLKYQEIRSPADGTVFELKAFNEGTVNSNSNEPVVQIVPDNNLIAKIYITNKDIGFVKKDSKVDVRIDAFPFSEFGDVKGTLEWVGSDALPPDQIYNYYRFPARVKLDSQSLRVNQGGTTRDIQLQTGMALNANIKLRDRTVMSIFTEMFTRQSDSLKNVR